MRRLRRGVAGEATTCDPRPIRTRSVWGDIHDVNDVSLLSGDQACFQFLNTLKKTPIDRHVLSATADLRAPFPQKPVRFLRIHARRDAAEINDTDMASRQEPALTEDLDGRVLISPTRIAHHQKNTLPFVHDSKLILKPANSSVYFFH